MTDDHGKKLASGSVVFFALAVLLIGMYLAGKVEGMDQAGFALAAGLRTEWLTAFFRALTNFGSAVVLAPLGAVLIIWLYARKRRAESVAVLLTLGGGELLNEALKAVFARERPTVFHLIEVPDSFSFPSGHAMIAPAFYLMLAYLASREYAGKTWVPILQPLTCLFVVLLAASRVYLGVHFPSDVLTGFCFSLCAYFFVRYGYERHLARRHAPVRPLSVPRE